MKQNIINGEKLTEDSFVSQYSDTMIEKGGAKIPLSTALAMEAAFCPADQQVRQDPIKRLRFLADLVGDNLLPEHQHLLLPPNSAGEK